MILTVILSFKVCFFFMLSEYVFIFYDCLVTEKMKNIRIKEYGVHSFCLFLAILSIGALLINEKEGNASLYCKISGLKALFNC